MYPTLEEIEKLHKKYAPNERLFDLVYKHCNIVWSIAQQIIEKKNLSVNADLVKSGALLHDIATYTYMMQEKEKGELHYYRHAYEGSLLLKQEGFSDEICSLVAHHLGVGLTKEEIIERNMDLPIQDFTPTTIEERLVMYSDKFHSKTPKFNTFASYSVSLNRFGPKGVAKFRALADEFGIPELELLAKKYNYPII